MRCRVWSESRDGYEPKDAGGALPFPAPARRRQNYLASPDVKTRCAAKLDGLKPSSRRRSSGKKGAVPSDQSRRTGALPLV